MNGLQDPVNMTRVIAVGPLPPPVHGASVMTRIVTDLLSRAGADIVACNISPAAKFRGWRWHWSRIAAYVRCYRTVFASQRGAIVYLSLSGGAGLIYDLVVVLLARIKAFPVVFHHHSFAYLDRPQSIFSLLLKVAPTNHLHVVLCAGMQRKLASRYGQKFRFVQVSNASFFDRPAQDAVTRHELRKIGFLSNLAMNKGVDRFLDLAAELASVSDLEVHIAGPFADAETQAHVEQRLAALPNVTCHGPLFGAGKQRFYDSIDMFVFLSRYPNEAEPLVIYEAMAAGLPVAVTGRGCLCELQGAPMAVVVDRDARDLAPLVSRIKSWKADPDAYTRASQAAIEKFSALDARRKTQIAEFLAAFGLVGASDEEAAPVQGDFHGKLV
jgi:glycosyltransferase involved in cell wall biosynthesis